MIKVMTMFQIKQIQLQLQKVIQLVQIRIVLPKQKKIGNGGQENNSSLMSYTVNRKKLRIDANMTIVICVINVLSY